jgi:two-component system LytT family response regulator
MKTKIKSEENIIHLGSRTILLPSKILMLKADINYTEVFLTDGTKILSSTTMGKIEKRLEGFDFFRPNRSTVVNMKYVQKPDKNKSSNFLIVKTLTKGIRQITISRRRLEPFFEYINQ